MRAAPPVQISLHRFGVWRAAVCMLAAAGLATVAGWLVLQPRPLAMAAILVAIGSVLLVIGAACSLVRPGPADLRWDGRSWLLGPAAGDPIAGEVQVAIDLGAWLLLRFVPFAGGRSRSRWLPVQRRGLEPQWHALRCAIYSPRAPLAADEPPVAF